MNDEINKRLKALDIEDFIWIIYIGIIIMSFTSNYYERKYFLKKDKKDKEKYRGLNKIIFTILLIVYLYFLKGSIEDFKNLKENDSKKKKQLVTLSLIASLLITISGLIFLAIACVDDNLDVEIAFN